MLDSEVIASILRGETLTKTPVDSVGSVENTLRSIAMSQVDGLTARESYNALGYQNASAQKDDLSGESIEEISIKLFDRVNRARNSIGVIQKEAWIRDFLYDAKKRQQNLVMSWESKRRELCDAKAVLHKLYINSNMKVSESVFRTKIAERMRDMQSDDWIIVKGLLDNLLGRVNL